jgi:hypothetical protein
MEEMNISDIYDPMELANDLVSFIKENSKDEYVNYINAASEQLAFDIMKNVGKNPQANRGVAILASSLMEVLSSPPDEVVEMEEAREFFYRFCTIGLPSLLLNILAHENIVNAKNALEGVLEI